MPSRTRTLARLGARAAALAAIGLGGALLAGGLTVARTGDAAPPPEPIVVPVARAVELDAYTATRLYAGRITPRQVTDVGFELAGRVAEMRADIGDRVEAGAVLATLDTDQILNQRDELRAARREAESDIELNARTLARVEALRARDASTEQALDNAQLALQASRARLGQIEARLASVETSLSDSRLTAPFAAQVTRRHVDEGAVLSAGQPVLRLNASGAIEAQIGVPAQRAAALSRGDRLEVNASGLSAEGVVTAIVGDLNIATRTVTVRLAIEDDPGFVAQDLARVALPETVSDTGIWAPAQALHESLRGLWAVYVVEPDGAGEGVVRRRDVEVVHLEENRAFVRGALSEGDLMVTTGAFRIVPGQRVRFREAAT